ncbi:MAG TPA: asparagine synthase (glutamine-hydrolyzing) [Bacteroidales bacterium]|nr:asparagine synthase (glutamine-hydrolyzing) [Bacteroidales bacterium]
MCGISGIIAFSETGRNYLQNIHAAVAAMKTRGPDNNGVYINGNVAFGHNRLSVIDVSDAASQPFTDESGRYTIVFNGEFFNFKSHRDQLISRGIQLKSTSDTEVLLYLYMLEGTACLQKINGFFALAIHDKHEDTVFIARDRMGVKPLLIYKDRDKLCFASEMKALFAMQIPKQLDRVSLHAYMQMNYIPANFTMISHVVKLEPGNYLMVRKNSAEQKQYYAMPYSPGQTDAKADYDTSCKRVKQLLLESVEKRMISDVPLGAFLSGGVDSSVIVALASQFTKQLNTFSIGFRDEPFFDETRYAQIVANKFNTSHTVFSLTQDDLLAVLFDVLDYVDDPFADSSAIAVYLLSRETRKFVTVALSGDGADELFGGYLKHTGEYKIRMAGPPEKLLKYCLPLINRLPQSRNSAFSNKVRQIAKYANGLKLSDRERYWRWCSFISEEDAGHIILKKIDIDEYLERKNTILKNITCKGSMNDVLFADMKHVLVNDMLTKVDLMSMASSLEVRTPFLDVELVNYVFSLPDSFKVQGNLRKRILQDAFKDDLPAEIFHRAKHGFEVPLLKWFRNELFSMINDDLLHDDFIAGQGIFSVAETKKLKTRLQSNNPGDVHAQIWGLLVFQYWWKKYFAN